MRPDMDKVIVERPRFGSRLRCARKGYRKELQRTPPDEQPRREGIKWRGGKMKMFNEHLGPLRRYLQSNVGRPWDKVFSEICERIDRGSVVQDHVRDHVDEYVIRDVVMCGRVPCHSAGRLYGRPLWVGSRGGQFFVCPKTGLLRQVPSRPAAEPEAKKSAQPVRVDDRQVCVFLDVAWHLVTVESLPEQWMLCEATDVVFGRRVSTLDPNVLRRTYGGKFYGVAKRRLSKREMKQLPIPIDLQ